MTPLRVLRDPLTGHLRDNFDSIALTITIRHSAHRARHERAADSTELSMCIVARLIICYHSSIH